MKRHLPSEKKAEAESFFHVYYSYSTVLFLQAGSSLLTFSQNSPFYMTAHRSKMYFNILILSLRDTASL